MRSIQEIAALHPQSVALLFSRYGYGHVPPSEKSLLAMAAKFGNKFVDDLSSLIAAQYETFVGADGRKTLVRKQPARAATIVPRDTRNINASGLLLKSVASPSVSLAPAKINPDYAEKTVAQMSAGATSTPEKRSLKDRITGFFQKALPILREGAAVYATATGKTPVPIPGPEDQPKDDQPKDDSKKWLLVGVAVIVILALFVFSKSDKVVK